MKFPFDYSPFVFFFIHFISFDFYTTALSLVENLKRYRYHSFKGGDDNVKEKIKKDSNFFVNIVTNTDS